MRNNIYCNKFILNSTDVEDNTTWIKYIHRKDLVCETGCISVCDAFQRKICDVLLHFDKITPVKVLRNRNLDEFWDEKPNYNRKLK